MTNVVIFSSISSFNRVILWKKINRTATENELYFIPHLKASQHFFNCFSFFTSFSPSLLHLLLSSFSYSFLGIAYLSFDNSSLVNS